MLFVCSWAHFYSCLNMVLVKCQITLHERHAPIIIFLVDGQLCHILQKQRNLQNLKPTRRGNNYQLSCISYKYISTKFFLFCAAPTTLVNKSAGFSSVFTCPVSSSSIVTVSLTTCLTCTADVMSSCLHHANVK